jgi:hypothetical protein
MIFVEFPSIFVDFSVEIPTEFRDFSTQTPEKTVFSAAKALFSRENGVSEGLFFAASDGCALGFSRALLAVLAADFDEFRCVFDGKISFFIRKSGFLVVKRCFLVVKWWFLVGKWCFFD